jgi:hypothetical protein
MSGGYKQTFVNTIIPDINMQAYVRRSQTFVNTTPTSTKRQLRTSLLHVLDHPKHVLRFPELFEYCGLSRATSVFACVYLDGALHISPRNRYFVSFLINEDYRSSCEIYLQRYLGSSAVLVILFFVVFGRSTLDGFLVFTSQQSPPGYVVFSCLSIAIAHI